MELIETAFGTSIFKMILMTMITGFLVHLASRTTPRYALALYGILALTAVYMIQHHHLGTPMLIFIVIGQILVDRAYQIYKRAGMETEATGNTESPTEKRTKSGWKLGPWLYDPITINREKTERKPMTSTRTQECMDLRTPDTYQVRLEVNSKGEQALLCPCCEGNGEHSNLSGNNPAAVLYPCGTCDGRGEISPTPNRT